MADTSLRYSASLTSDIPSGIVYPGKPLTKRFNPLTNSAFSNLPLSTQPRRIQPVALSGTVTLPVKGERVFEVGDDLRKPLEARLNRMLTPLQTSEETISFNQPRQLTQNAKPAEEIKSELDNLKELAKQELARRARIATDTKAAQISSLGETNLISPEVVPAAPATNQTSVPQIAQPAPEPVKTQETPKAVATTTREPKTEFLPVTEPNHPPKDKLFEELKTLEAEIANLQKEFSFPEQTPKPVPPEPIAPPVMPVDQTKELKAQINQLLAEKTTLLQKINDLTTANKAEIEKRAAVERKTETLAQQIEAEQKRQNELLAQINQLRSEKLALENQLKMVEKLHSDIEELKSNLRIAQAAKKAAEERVSKLEALVAEIGQKEKQPAPKPAIKAEKTPKPDEVSEKPAQVRIVKPQIAIGKMAPSLTTAPNVINGIIRDANGLLLTGVIIVVKNDKGEPVRALKSNKIGQFAISTPLPNGTYTIELEYPEKSFDIVEVELKGEVLPPIEVRANN